MSQKLLTAQALADYKLATLPEPSHGFTPDLKEHFKDKKPQEIEGIEDQIVSEVDRIRTLLQAIGLPQEIMDHPIYRPFLLEQFPFREDQIDDNNPLIKIRNILSLVPLHPDIHGVIEILRHIADHVLSNMEIPEETPEATKVQANESLVNGMLQMLETNLRILDEHDVIRKPTSKSSVTALTSPFRPQKPSPILQGFSFRQIRTAAQKIWNDLNPKLEAAPMPEAKEKLLRNACIQLMIELDIFKRGLSVEEKREFLDVEMPSCMSKARALYHRIGKESV